MSKTDLSPEELETVKVPRLPTTVITANGSIDTNEEATVYVKDLDILVTVQLFEDTPAVLSLGKPCEENGSSYEWKEGQTPTFFFRNKSNLVLCKCDNFVLIAVPGRSSEAHLVSSADDPPEYHDSRSQCRQRRRRIAENGLQSYPCKTKPSQETARNLRKIIRS